MANASIKKDPVGTRESYITPEIVLALRAGSHEAYKEVYLRYKEPLELFLVKLMGSREDAGEVLQDTFVNVWEKRERIDPDRNIKAYLFTIAKNTALKHMANRKRFGGEEDYNLFISEDYAPDRNMMEEDTRLIVEIALHNMPRQRREVYELYLTGCDYDEIAEKLGLNKDNVTRHVSYARRDIKHVLALMVFFLLG